MFEPTQAEGGFAFQRMRVVLGHMAKIGVAKTKYLYVDMNDRDVREAVHNTVSLGQAKSLTFPL